MYIVQVTLETVELRTGSYIPILIKINFVFWIKAGPELNRLPYSHVELSAPVEQRFFQIFLNYPTTMVLFRLQEVHDVFYIFKKLYSPTLILIHRLNNPEVLLAVFFRYLFLVVFIGVVFNKFLKKFFEFIVLAGTVDNKSARGGFPNCVFILNLNLLFE